jgi:hypothetical protein
MVRVMEGLDIHDFAPEERDIQVGLLEEPWIGDEGPTDAGFRRELDRRPLRPRGVAFDDQTTVVWDEHGVQVLRSAPPPQGMVALASKVLLHSRFAGPAELTRIDYIERGCLVGSRYVPYGIHQGAQGYA